MSDLESRENPYNVTQASRIYLLPNLMTAGNLFCGFVAVIKCIQARLESTAPGTYPQSPAELYVQAVWFILAAVIFDSLDGRLARLGGRESLFGAEFDSLADVVSFGVAPALMMFFLILSPTQGIPLFRMIGWLVGFIYLLCAAVRLARFNVITNPYIHHEPKELSRDFVGLPVPAAAGTVASLVLFMIHLAENNRELHRWSLLLPGLLLLIALLMVSSIRYPSFKQVDWQLRTRVRTFVLVIIFAGFGFWLQEVVFLILFLGYIFYGLGRYLRRSQLARRRRRDRRRVVNKPTALVQ
ncbi:MAG: CDP-diacylglycerol--serine O-phosphatidyltransferase [Verrucomicrobia bacterium RIFCSPLOWO2_12_FULL_64_8]|nr:MAG: CDP-diacylglycerol--serine O-phosphatidyltransferase [Verrucomicrobia bacterium RIFCSPLOWO2_12_FULL_64_8]